MLFFNFIFKYLLLSIFFILKFIYLTLLMKSDFVK